MQVSASAPQKIGRVVPRTLFLTLFFPSFAWGNRPNQHLLPILCYPYWQKELRKALAIHRHLVAQPPGQPQDQASVKKHPPPVARIEPLQCKTHSTLMLSLCLQSQSKGPPTTHVTPPEDFPSLCQSCVSQACGALTIQVVRKHLFCIVFWCPFGG